MLILGWIAVSILVIAAITRFISGAQETTGTTEAIGLFVGTLINAGIVFLFIWFMYH